MPRQATDWESAYLRALGAPNTTANRRFLAAWQRWEGGHTNNDARWNYLNTTQRMRGSSSINSVGVQRYGSLTQGAQAFARTLRNGKYGDLLGALRAGDPYSHNVTAGLSTWLSGSPTSSHGAAYASKVLGTSVAPPPASQGVSGAPVDAQDLPAPPDLSAGRMDVINQIASGGHYDPFHSLQALTASLMAQGHLDHAPDPKMLGPFPLHVQGKTTPQVQQAIKLAEHYIGTPYQWGGSSPKTGFDCSGLLQWAWGQVGVKIPRTTYEQIKAGVAVSRRNLRPGDAIFFGSKSDPHHVGMYIGGGRFIESPHTGANVRISKLAGRRDVVAYRRYQ